jgi:hypothetical protein
MTTSCKARAFAANNLSVEAWRGLCMRSSAKSACTTRYNLATKARSLLLANSAGYTELEF